MEIFYIVAFCKVSLQTCLETSCIQGQGDLSSMRRSLGTVIDTFALCESSNCLCS